MKQPAWPTTVDSAVIYSRASSDEQEEDGLSLEAQVAECRRYVARQGWAIVGEFQDVMSGSRDDRPDYRRMLAGVRSLRSEGRGVAVVVSALDRLGRRLLEQLLCRKELRELGVGVHFLAEGGELDDDTANQLAVDAAKEVNRLRRRVKAVWKRAAERGWLKTTSANWGYRWRPRTDEERRAGAPNSVLDVDPLAAPFAREAFDRVAQGQSARSVALWMAGLPDDSRGGRRLDWAAAQRMLRSPVYVARQPGGNRVSGVEVLERPVGQWPALIEDVTWAAVQARIEGRAQPRKTNTVHVLTGWLRCPVDGSRMHGGGEGRKYSRRYRCGAVSDGVRCTQTAVCEPVERLVLAEAAQVIDRIAGDAKVQEALRRAWLRLQEPQVDQDAAARRQRAKLRLALDKLQRRRTTATERYADGDIGKTEYDELIAKNRAETAAVERDLAALTSAARTQPALPSIDVVLTQAGSWSRVLVDSDVARQRDVLALLIERVEPVRVSHAGRSVVYDVRITWTPLGEALRARS